jgi:hypothetical protein
VKLVLDDEVVVGEGPVLAERGTVDLEVRVIDDADFDPDQGSWGPYVPSVEQRERTSARWGRNEA